MVDRFSDLYKNNLFYLWYNKNKPPSTAFYRMLPDDENGNHPTLYTIREWMTDWKSRADVLDEQVSLELEGRLVQEKIAMLERHSELGVKAQDMAMSYLEAHKEELSPNSAVRLLVEGVRIERESRGIPQALRKLTEQSDEELLKQIEEIVSKGEVYEETND